MGEKDISSANNFNPRSSGQAETIRHWLSEQYSTGRKHPANKLEQIGEDFNHAPALKTLPAYDSKECMRCHPQHEAQMPQFDYKFFAQTREDFKPASAADQAARELERFKNEDSLEKALHIISRLPENVQLRLDGKKASLQTDFTKLVEAIPTLCLNDRTKTLLDAAKNITVDGDHISVQLKQSIKFPINKTEPLVGKITELAVGDEKQQLSFENGIDKSGQRLTLKEIHGLNINLENGKSIGIREISLDASGSKPMLNVTFDNPKECPSKMMEKFWPKTITLAFPLESISAGTSSDLARAAITGIKEIKSALQDRDAQGALDSIANADLREKVKEILGGLSSLTKIGNAFEIARSGGVIHHDLGGAELTLQKNVRFKLDHGAAGTSVSAIDGISLSALLPTKLGLGDNYITSPSSITLSPKYGSHRTLTVRADNVIQSASISIDDNFKPRTDAHGNWSVDTVIKNPLSAGEKGRLNFRFQFDQNGKFQNKSSDILDFISRATWQASEFSRSGSVMMAGSTVSGLASRAMWLVGK